MLSKSFSDQKIAASVGAGLLAMAVCQATGMLDVPALSQASRLLRGGCDLALATKCRNQIGHSQSLKLASKSPARKIKASRRYRPSIHVDFSLSYAPFEKARKIKMLEASLSQLEQLVSDLVQQNQALLGTNQTLSAELAQAKDENESLQLSLMEQEEKQGATAARIQALVERVSAGPVNA
jgi:hypothetical protein